VSPSSPQRRRAPAAATTSARKRAPADAPSLAEYQHAARLRAALRAFLRRGEEISRSHGLTPQRYLLMLMIHGAPDGSRQATVSELAQRLSLAQSTVTELIDRSEAAGLVTRVASDADGRVVFVRLTPEGERRLAPAVKDLRAERAALREVLSTDADPAG
jgi:DNA-binding MarR family transcriptional regulator